MINMENFHNFKAIDDDKLKDKKLKVSITISHKYRTLRPRNVSTEMKTLTLITLLAASVLALPSGPSSRIWNGQNARPGQAPYMIGILWYETLTTVQPINICGGAIVNQWWVITAAHCLDNNLTGIGRFEIVAGQHFVSIPNRSGREQFRNLALEIFHPQYRGGASSYDIALIRLDRPLEFNDFVQPIALAAQTTRPPQAGRVTVFGWGTITAQPPHSLPDQLQVRLLC
jgi:secreted trypsin-like serine protease